MQLRRIFYEERIRRSYENDFIIYRMKEVPALYPSLAAGFRTV